MKYRLFFGLLILHIFFLSSCKEEPVKNDFSIRLNSDILVSCEGQFNNMNAGLTFIDVEEDTVNVNVFNEVNSTPIGDVVQSIIQKDQKIIFLNNLPGSVMVANKQSLKLEHTISITGSPRNIAISDDETNYVSDVFSGIHVVNFNTNTLEKTIETNGATHELIQVDNKVLVCNYGGYTDPQKEILIYDKSVNTLQSKITVTSQPTSLTRVGDNLYVICQGDFTTAPSIEVINLNNLSLEETINLENKIPVSYNFKIRSFQNRIYVLGDALYELDIQTKDVTKIFTQATYPYGLDVDELTGNLWVTDAKDFSSQGEFYVLSSEGELLTSYQVGFVPNGALMVR